MKSYLLVLLLFLPQLIFTLNSNSQIRYEEVVESIRNVFWFDSRLIFDGVSSNIGWYGSLLVVYKIFGFGLFYAKYFKLFLWLVSILCLSSLLKRFLGEKPAILPLIVIALSPTLLFSNTSQTGIGADLLYFPIVLFLLLNSKLWIRVSGWALAMIAWMSYPTFIFYLPVLAVVAGKEKKNILIFLIFFILPLTAGFIYLNNKEILFNDPTSGNGIFRGAGNFEINAGNFSKNLGGILNDFFHRGQSYHFEIYKAEFSDWLPAIAIILIIVFGGINKMSLGIISLMILNIIISSLTVDPSGYPGMRRFTPALAAIYVLFILSWKKNYKKMWMVGLVVIILLHHIITYPINLSHLKDPSPNQTPFWINSFYSLLEETRQDDSKIICEDEHGKPIYCRYAEIYSAVAGACKWNHLNCKNIYGYDLRSGNFVPLSVDWKDDI